MPEKKLARLLAGELSPAATQALLDGVGVSAAGAEATLYQIEAPLTAMRRVCEYFTGPEQHLALVTLLLADNDSALYTKGQQTLADASGLTKRTVERYFSKWDQERCAAKQPKREGGTLENNWRGFGYNLALREPFATPKKNGGGSSSSNGGAAGAGGGGSAPPASGYRRASSSTNSHSDGETFSPAAAATSASAPRRTPIRSAEGSPETASAPQAVFARAIVVDAGAAGEPTYEITAEDAYEDVVAAYRVQARDRFGAQAPVRRNKDPEERNTVGAAVGLLAIECRLSVPRAAELVVAAFLASTSKGKREEKWPLAFLAAEVEEHVATVRDDLNRAAQRRAAAEHKANKDAEKKGELSAAVAAAGVAPGSTTFDLDAMGYGRVDDDEAAA